MLKHVLLIHFRLVLVLVTSLATHALAITIDTVPVGNAGNPADPSIVSLRSGAVGYSYRIGTTEVTVGQYMAFLNSVAATDTYELYNPVMGSDPNVAGIREQAHQEAMSIARSIHQTSQSRPLILCLRFGL